MGAEIRNESIVELFAWLRRRQRGGVISSKRVNIIEGERVEDSPCNKFPLLCIIIIQLIIYNHNFIEKKKRIFFFLVLK
jgi:hypothetical protein